LYSYPFISSDVVKQMFQRELFVHVASFLLQLRLVIHRRSLVQDTKTLWGSHTQRFIYYLAHRAVHCQSLPARMDKRPLT